MGIWPHGRPSSMIIDNTTIIEKSSSTITRRQARPKSLALKLVPIVFTFLLLFGQVIWLVRQSDVLVLDLCVCEDEVDGFGKAASVSVRQFVLRHFANECRIF